MSLTPFLRNSFAKIDSDILLVCVRKLFYNFSRKCNNPVITTMTICSLPYVFDFIPNVLDGWTTG